MRSYILDTNALISFVTDRNPTQQDIVAEIVADASMLKHEILCPQNVITEFVYVLDKVYQVSRPKIGTLIQDFIETPGMEIVHEVDFQVLLNIWPRHISEYGDALVATVCQGVRDSVVVTFDRYFRNKLQKLKLAVLPSKK